MHLRLAVVTIAMLTACAVSKGDVINVFPLNGTTSLSNLPVYSFSGAPFRTKVAPDSSTNDFGGVSKASQYDFDLSLPRPTPVRYTDGTTAASLSGVAATQKPSGLLLLGMGVLGFGVLLRKRYV